MPPMSEDGFTLLEVIIATTIGVVLIGVIGAALVLGYRATAGTATTLAESHDAQLISTYLPADTQSTTLSNINVSNTPDPGTGCSSAAVAGDLQNILHLEWSETVSGTTTTYAASYRLNHNGAGSEWQIVRYYCVKGSAASAQFPVAHNLATSSATNVSVCGAGRITLTVTEASGYTYTVSGTTRTPPTVATVPCPAATPAVSTMAMYDGNSNGKVDQVLVTFSISLPAACGSAGSTWSLSGVPSNGTRGTVTVSGPVATIPITEGSGGADTAVGSFRVTFAPGAGCAAQGFSNVAPADLAPPAVTNVTSPITATTAGKMEVANSLQVTFSEPILGAPSSTTTTEADPAGSGNDAITIAGITNGAVDTGSNNYINSDGRTATFPATVTVLGAQLTVVLGTPCSGTACASNITAGQGTFKLLPATTLADAAGNPAMASFSTASSFRIF